jgi:hypothetical protein
MGGEYHASGDVAQNIAARKQAKGKTLSDKQKLDLMWEVFMRE